MARLSGSILTEDAELKTQMTALLRGGAVPVTVTDERPSRGSVQDVVVVDGRFGLEKAIGLVEHVRSLDATVGIFFVASDSSPDAILTVDAGRRQRVLRLAAVARGRGRGR